MTVLDDSAKSNHVTNSYIRISSEHDRCRSASASISTQFVFMRRTLEVNKDKLDFASFEKENVHLKIE